MVVNQVGSIVGLGNINSNIRLLQPGVDPTDGDGTIKLKMYYNIVDFG
jgi:hypothetical protein